MCEMPKRPARTLSSSLAPEPMSWGPGQGDEDEEGEAYGDEYWHGEHESHPIISYNIIYDIILNMNYEI